MNIASELAHADEGQFEPLAPLSGGVERLRIVVFTIAVVCCAVFLICAFVFFFVPFAVPVAAAGSISPERATDVFAGASGRVDFVVRAANGRVMPGDTLLRIFSEDVAQMRSDTRERLSRLRDERLSVRNSGLLAAMELERERSVAIAQAEVSRAAFKEELANFGLLHASDSVLVAPPGSHTRLDRVRADLLLAERRVPMSAYGVLRETIERERMIALSAGVARLAEDSARIEQRFSLSSGLSTCMCRLKEDSLLVVAGETVRIGQRIGALYSEDSWLVRVAVQEQQSSSIAIGARVVFDVPALEQSGGVGLFGNVVRIGPVSETAITPAVREAVRPVQEWIVEIRPASDDRWRRVLAKLRWGYSVHATILGTRETLWSRALRSVRRVGRIAQEVVL